METIPNTTSEAQDALSLVVKGLTPVERQLLEGVIRVSQRDTRRRAQRLHLLDDARAREADVLIVDARDPAAAAWARQQDWLNARTVIWLDATTVPPGHTLARRPVQWPILPVLLARALEQRPAPATPQAADAPSPLAGTRPQPRILVVDDSAMARTQLRALLEQRGYAVDDEPDVASALLAISVRRFDCVLMDVLMPGADGYEGCREIKSLPAGSKLPVVMLTGKSSPFDRIRGRMAGCDAYLVKPVDPDNLGSVLAQIVQAPSRQADSQKLPGAIPPLAPAS